MAIVEKDDGSVGTFMIFAHVEHPDFLVFDIDLFPQQDNELDSSDFKEVAKIYPKDKIELNRKEHEYKGRFFAVVNNEWFTPQQVLCGKVSDLCVEKLPAGEAD